MDDRQAHVLLIVEDNPGDARLIRAMLDEAMTVRFEMTVADHLAAGLERLAQGGVDVVLLDLALPDSQGLETLRRTREAAPQVPVVVLTGLGDEATGLVAMSQGAQDYLMKGQVESGLLVRSLIYAIERQRLGRQLRQLSQAVEQSPASVVITDTDGNIEYVNPKFTEVTGYTLEEVRGQNPRILKSGLTPPEEYERLWQTITAGREWQGQFCNRKKNGELYWESASISPVRDPAGHITHFVAVKEDITDRKRAEDALCRANRAYRVLSRSSQTLVRADDETALLQEVCRIVVEAGGYRLAWVGFAEQDEARTVRPVAQAGYDAGYLKTVDIHWDESEFGRGPTGRAIRSGQAQVARDIAHDPTVAWREQALLRGYQSSLALPLIVEEDVIGVLSILAGEPDAFDEADLTLLKELADDLGFGLTALRTDARRAQAEAALRQLKEFNESIVQSMAEGIALEDEAGRFTFVNPAAAAMLGYTPGELIGQPWTMVVPPDQHPTVQAADERRARGETDQYEIELVRKDGSRLHALVSGSPRLEDGRLVSTMAVFTDISGLKQMEEAEREQRALAEALRDSIAALTSTLDPDEVLGRILANVSRVVPYDAANVALIQGDALVITHRQGYPPEMAAFFDEALTHAPLEWPTYRTMIETGAPYLVADVHHDPAWRWFPGGEWARSYVTAPIKVHGHVIGFLNLESHTAGFFTPAHAERLQAFADQAAVAVENAQLYDEVRHHAADLERRVAARTAELEQQRAQLQATLDAMGEGVIYDEKLQTRYINRALAEMTGYTLDEWYGYLDPLKSETMTDEELAALTQRIYDTVTQEGIWRGEVTLRRKNGEEFDAALTCTQVAVRLGNLAGAVTLIRDISQQKALQAQKDRFIANAAHELRTPVTNITMRFYLLRKQPHRMGEHLDALERSVETMRHLVEALLDLSRFERGIISLEKETVVLQEVLGAVIDAQHPQAEAKHISLTCDLPDPPLSAVIDPERIQQVITNLVVNAINYTPDGGRVSVRLEAAPDQATIQVQDTGIGIGPDVLPHIFEPFFRAREIDVPGTGLGLSITREIIHLHGGTIAVDSQVGQGSAFTVRLPLL